MSHTQSTNTLTTAHLNNPQSDLNVTPLQGNVVDTAEHDRSGEYLSQHDTHGLDHHSDSSVGSRSAHSDRDHVNEKPHPGAAPAPAGPGGPGGPAGPGGRPQLDKYTYSFLSPQMAGMRKIALKILGPAMILTIVFMWACLPVYWGSLWKSNVYTDKLTVRVIDRDGGVVGQTISQFLLSESSLGYFSSPSTEFTTNDAVVENVLDEGSWAALVISQGATANLLSARQNGLTSYNGSQAIEVYYSQARNEIAVNSYLVPLMSAHLGQVLGRLNAQSVAQYISANSGNATAMNLLAQAPTTVTNGLYYTLNNLRPYNQPVAQAITLVGLIYMLIFSFIVTMVGSGVRDIISPYMTTRALIAYRLAVPILLYIPLALSFSMVSLPFKAHFDAHFTYAGGFFLWFFTFWLGMCSVGLSLEFAITILTARFIAFFMIALIICNVSVAALPHELMPWIFRYQAAMPFYNVGRTVRTIIFNTKNEIGMNLGILIAWTVLSMITISLATWGMRRKEVNAYKQQKRDEGKAV